MKWLLLLPGLLLLTAASVDAQRLKLFRSIIYTSRGERIDGILYDMTDSTVQYVPNQADFIRRLRDGQVPAVFDIHRDSIDRIVIRRKGHVSRGTSIGAGIGLVAGIGIAVFVHPAASRAVDAGFTDLIKVLAILTAPVSGAEYGALFSIIPYRIRRIRQSEEAFKTAKTDLKWLSVGAQRRVNAAGQSIDHQP